MSGCTVPAVEIRTPRLRLRPFEVADLPARLALGAAPEFYRFIGGKAATEEESWHRVLRYVGHWASFGFGTFAVLDGASGAFLGEAGAMDFRRGIGAEFGRLPEMGWGFLPEVHGTGLAGEAIRAVLRWMDGGAGAASTVCIIADANLPSVRIAERMGYRANGEALYHGQPVRTYLRPAGATFATAPG
jgi:RimJ/RimL family protein N-acetyltransferase